MSKTHFEEKAPLTDRARSLVVLALFTLAISVIATLAMDILVLPVSLFAVKYTETFSLIIRKSILYSFIGICLFLLIRRIVQLNRAGLSWLETALHLTRRIGHYAGLTLIFLVISGIIIGFIYYLLSSNDLVIHNITGS